MQRGFLYFLLEIVILKNGGGWGGLEITTCYPWRRQFKTVSPSYFIKSHHDQKIWSSEDLSSLSQFRVNHFFRSNRRPEEPNDFYVQYTMAHTFVLGSEEFTYIRTKKWILFRSSHLSSRKLANVFFFFNSSKKPS